MFEKQKHLLAKRKAANAFRFLKQSEGLVDFCSNDYLGIAKASKLLPSNPLPTGSGGSRLLAGNYSEIEKFETRIADFHKVESALVFNSGYNANVGFFSSVPQKGDTIFYDELIHASIKDGMRLSFAKCYAFKHNDLDDLSKKLNHAEGDVYVAIEAVYSMDGDNAPLNLFSEFCSQKGLVLVVDEAHSVGVFGSNGAGLVQKHQLQDKIPIRIVTFGKAIGAHGAAVLCNEAIKDYLINFSRSFIYTTSLPPSSIDGLHKNYELLQSGERTLLLRNKIDLFLNSFEPLFKINLIKSESAIQCVVFSGNEAVKKAAENIQHKGFDVRPVLSPTVKKGQERIRVCLHTFNSDAEILALVKAIQVEITN